MDRLAQEHLSETLLSGNPSAEHWDQGKAEQRVIYGYISERFSQAQRKMYGQLLGGGHPWMQRVIIVSKEEFHACCGHDEQEGSRVFQVGILIETLMPDARVPPYEVSLYGFVC